MSAPGPGRDRSGPPASWLEGLNRVGPGQIIPFLYDALRQRTDLRGLRLLLADLDEVTLESDGVLRAGITTTASSIPLVGTRHGDAYRSGAPSTMEADGNVTVVVPVTARREREGVLEATYESSPDTEAVELLVASALLLGYLITAADRWTDEFHIVRRRKHVSLAAEIQWNQLPLTAFASSEISLAGALEPAYEVGGDAFDYACGPRLLHAALFDAMGHGLASARLSSLALATYRNMRRLGATLEDQASAVHEVLLPNFDREGFVTGVMLEIDLTSPSRSRAVCAGHPSPLLQRPGGSAQPLVVDQMLPFGVPFPNPAVVGELHMAPGDRITLYSDGVVEARPLEGSAFGETLLSLLLERMRRDSPRETARAIVRAVRDHRSAELVDDATVLVIDLQR